MSIETLKKINEWVFHQIQISSNISPLVIVKIIILCMALTVIKSILHDLNWLHRKTSSSFYQVFITKCLYFHRIRLLESDSWGYQINGSYTGIVGDMIKGITDISVAPMLLRPERLPVIEFTVQTYIMK